MTARLSDRELLEALFSHVSVFAEKLTQQTANIEDLRSRFRTVEEKAEQARAAAQLAHNRLDEALSEGGMISNIASGLFAISADLQQLRESVTQQVSHDAERRAKLEKTLEQLEEDFREQEHATGRG